jgi:hypothetical protein
LKRAGVTFWPVFDVVDSLMKDLPGQTALAMGNRPNGLVMPHADDQTVIQQLKYTSFGLHRRIGGLIDDLPHHAVALGGTIVLGYLGRFFPSRAHSDPGCQLARGGKRSRRGADLRNHLLGRVLGRVYPKPRHAGQPHHRLLVLHERAGYFPVQGSTWLSIKSSRSKNSRRI